jgi:hypothetical protein
MVVGAAGRLSDEVSWLRQSADWLAHPDADRLGLAVQLCTLPWLGFVPDEVTAAPGAAVHRLAERLQVDSGVLARLWGAAQRPGPGPRLGASDVTIRPALPGPGSSGELAVTSG